MITEEMVDDMRNALRGFGCWLADERNGRLELYGENANGRVLAAWNGASSAYTIHTESDGEILVASDVFDPERMKQVLYDHDAWPVQYDDVACEDETLPDEERVEDYSDQLDKYQSETLNRLGLVV